MRLLLILLALWAALPSARAAAVYWTPEALFEDMFPTADRATELALPLDAARLERARAALGYTPAKSAYTFTAAWQGGTLLGWMLVDEQLGQHEPITFAVQLDPQGRVVRHEVMVYRERYGDEVRDKRFRAQFIGKTAADPLVAGRDVRIVSGATLSSKAMATGVKRAVVLFTLMGPSGGA